MTTVFSPSTPSPPPDLPTPPPAPRFGIYQDNWEPYPSRKSARISSQQTSDGTPSPRDSHRKSRKENHKSQGTMVSPTASPQKKHQLATGASQQTSDSLTTDGTATVASAPGLNFKPGQKQTSSSAARAAGMLPTPSKTPQKPPTAKTAAEIDAFARNLFPADETAASGSQKRRVKKYSGVTMDSFTTEDIDESFEIFTDSQDRIPKKDKSGSNPFWGAGAQYPESSKGRSHAKQVAIPGEGLVSVHDAVRREDGFLSNFRGKKVFRKYAANDSSPSEGDMDGAEVETRLTQPLTRSSVTPRILFPKKTNDQTLEDEEATTDVEDASMAEDADAPQTPTKTLRDPAPTPSAPRFAPASPPDTKRITRSTNKLAAEAKKSEGSRCSPFDAWRRTKDHTKSQAEKRPAEPVDPSNAKRTRT